MTVRKSPQSSRARIKPTQDVLHALMQDLVRVPGATNRVTERIPNEADAARKRAG